MGVQKVSQYFFIIAAVIAILDGALELDVSMRSLKFSILILAGVIVGILRHYKQREFILAGLAVTITGFILLSFLGELSVLGSIGQMIFNFIVFLCAAVVVVGIEQIAGIITSEEEEKKDPKEEIKRLKKLLPNDIQTMTFERVWGIIILIGVAFTFIILLAEAFFDASAYEAPIRVLNGLITVLFIVDLGILYKRAENFGEFIRRNIFDVIAAIPTVGVFRGLKLIRAARIIRVLRGTGKITKVAHLYKTSKFFSKESYFNKVEKEELAKQRIKKLKVEQRARSKKTKKKTTKKKVVKKTPSKATKKQSSKKKR